ncbi:hypothetical protein O6H91_Y096200 [Diphasiastrum complanatum]|nr:hypothetical protein O6H91_Y096200 [Diphasiastrum complanatum]
MIKKKPKEWLQRSLRQPPQKEIEGYGGGAGLYIFEHSSFIFTIIMSFCSVLAAAAAAAGTLCCPPTVSFAAARESLHISVLPLQATSRCNANAKSQHFTSNLFFPVSTCPEAPAPTSEALSLLLPPKALQWRSSGSIGSLEHITAELRIMKCGKKAGFKIRACNFADSAADEWVKLLPDKKAALYSHSLPCIEAWLRTIGFRQSKDDRAIWIIERPDWHAQLSLDITDLYIRYVCSSFVVFTK